MEELEAIVIHHQPLDDITLKKLLLIFDKVSFIDPTDNEHLIPDGVPQIDFHVLVHSGSYAPLYKGRSYASTDYDLFDRFRKAIDENILNVLDLYNNGFYNKNWLPLKLSFDYDTANGSFASIFKPLFESKITWNPGDTVLPGDAVRDDLMHSMAPKLYPKLPEPQIIFDAEDEYKVGNFYDHQFYSIIAKLNKALLVSNEYKQIPVFINKHIAEGFSKKFEIAKANKEIKFGFEEKFNFNPILLQQLLYRVSDYILSDEILKELSVIEIIKIREGTMGKLYKLRRELIQSIEFLSSVHFDEGSLGEVEEFINKKFLLQLTLYRNQYLEQLSKVLKHSSTFIFGLAGSAFGFSQALSPTDIAILGSVSATVGGVVSDLPDTLLNKSRNKFYNTYSYFLDIK
ncbi:hypothetical protein GCM10028895_17300 [Pontibacter rugosus]